MPTPPRTPTIDAACVRFVREALQQHRGDVESTTRYLASLIHCSRRDVRAIVQSVVEVAA